MNKDAVKEMVVAKLTDYKEEIYQKGDKQHQDSFWYEGVIAKFKKGNREVEVVASGEIEIRKKGVGRIYMNGQEIGEGFGFKVENDKDLAKVRDENGFDWNMNNWFEYRIGNTDGMEWIEELDFIIDGGLDDAIETGKEVLFDDDLFKEYGLK